MWKAGIPGTNYIPILRGERIVIERNAASRMGG